MKILRLVFIVSLFWNKAYAQIVNANDASGAPIRVLKYDKIEGTPYLNNGDWSSGIVITQNDKYLSDLKIRYNAYEDQLQYLYNGSPFYYENQDIKSFEFSKVDELGNVERFYFRNGYEFQEEIKKKDFIRVLYDGQFIKLLAKVQARKQLVTPAAYGEDDFEKFIITVDTYLFTNGQMQKMKLKKGQIINGFPSVKGQLKSYFKENVVDFDRAKDVADLFEYIDEELM